MTRLTTQPSDGLLSSPKRDWLLVSIPVRTMRKGGLVTTVRILIS